MRIYLSLALAFVSTEVEANRYREASVLSEHSDGRGIAVGHDGTRYLTGAVSDSAADGSDPNDRHPFIVALDTDGGVKWRRQWDGLGQAHAVTVTDDGPVVIVKFRSKRFDADPGSETVVVADDGRAGVAVALTFDGAVRWTWSAPRARLDAVGAFPDGSVAIAGATEATLAQGFVARVDSDGKTRWSRALRNSSTIPQALAISDGGIFATGLSDRPLGSRTVGGAAFVARLDLNGRLDWLQKIGEPGSTCKGYSIAADSERVVIGGLFRGRIDFDPGPARKARESRDEDDDGFAAQFDIAGRLNWVHTFGANSSDQVRAVALSSSNTLVLGLQTEVVDLGGRVGRQDPLTKMFLVTLDAAGNAIHATSIVADSRAGGYPPVYIGSMTIHDHRLFVIAELSRSATVLGRTLVPVGPPGRENSMIWIELSVDGTAPHQSRVEAR